MLLNNNKNLPHKELENEAINQLLIISMKHHMI